MLQYYGIEEWRKVPLRKLATYANGLGNDSRVGRKEQGVQKNTPSRVILDAYLIDIVGAILYNMGGLRSPLHLVEDITKENELEFLSVSDFDTLRKEVLKNGTE